MPRSTSFHGRALLGVPSDIRTGKTYEIMTDVRIVNVADLSPGSAFIEPNPGSDVDLQWSGHSGLPANLVERYIKRPRISRVRAALLAARDAKRADLIISHLPRMTAMTEHAMAWLGVDTPHLAFSFNFTDLPSGADHRRLSRAFSHVERFCVYSGFEIDLYSAHFGIPRERFRHVMWGQTAPATDLAEPVPDRPYIVAIGGEGRDYGAMIQAARARPDIAWLVVARPNKVLEHAPANMTIYYNLDAGITWGLAARSAAVVVPLQTDRTCCGHITIASTQLLGIPLITTRSEATVEYVEAMDGTAIVEPGDIDGLAAAAGRVIENPAAASSAARDDIDRASQRYDRGHWNVLLEECVADLVQRPRAGGR